MTEPAAEWKRCSACKKPIAFGERYFVCNVSTCNRKRTALSFCSVSCWEVHLPIARHRESWAEERTAPTAAEAAREAAAEADRPTPRAPRRRIVEAKRPAESTTPREAKAPSSSSSADVPEEVLIVASRLKDYVRAVSGMNTSDRVLEPLSRIVREAVDRALENARRDERKTLLDRDFPKDGR